MCTKTFYKVEPLNRWSVLFDVINAINFGIAEAQYSEWKLVKWDNIVTHL